MENIRLKLLSADEIGVICDKCKEFLSTKGTQVDHKEVLKRLSKTGAQVDFDTQQVRLPKDVTEAALKVVPRKVALGGHSGRKDLIVCADKLSKRGWLHKALLLGYRHDEGDKIERMAWWLSIAIVFLIVMLSGGVIPWIFGLLPSRPGWYGALAGP